MNIFIIIIINIVVAVLIVGATQYILKRISSKGSTTKK